MLLLVSLKTILEDFAAFPGPQAQSYHSVRLTYVRLGFLFLGCVTGNNPLHRLQVIIVVCATISVDCQILLSQKLLFRKNCFLGRVRQDVWMFRVAYRKRQVHNDSLWSRPYPRSNLWAFNGQRVHLGRKAKCDSNRDPHTRLPLPI